MAYWSKVHRQALADARHALWLETGERAVIALILAALTIVLLWLLGGHEAATTELIAKAAGTAAILLLFPFFYLWKFLRAIVLFDAKAGEKISRYEDSTLRMRNH